MSFAESFRDLDPGMIERAFAGASEKLYGIAAGGQELGEQVADMFEEIEQASPGFMALIGKMEETIEMLEQTPTLEFGDEWYRMAQMNLGVLSVGLVLAEYARLESEET